MKPNLLSQMVRNAILLLLFFGWGTGSLVANSAVADSGLDYGVGNPTILHEVSTEWEEVNSTNAGQTSGIENLSSISEPHGLVAMDRFATLPGLPQGFKPFVLDRSFEELFFGALHKFKSSPDALSQIIGKVSYLGPSKMPDLLADLKFIDAQGNAIGDDLLEFLLSADDIAVFERRLGAWEDLIKGPNIRKKIHWLEGFSKWADEGYEFVETSTGVIVKSGDDIVVEVVDDIPKLTKHKVIPKPDSEVIRHAVDVNAEFLSNGLDAPYHPDFPAIEFNTVSNEGLVRVFKQGSNNPNGRWMAKQSEIQGMTPQQIKDHLALPEVPDKIVDVTIPPDIRLRTGKVKDNFNSPGGGNQFEIPYPDNVNPGWFGTPTDL